MKCDKKLIIITVIIAILFVGGVICAVVTYTTTDHRNMWQQFADQMNDNTDYYLEKNQAGSCGYVKTLTSEYSMTLSVDKSNYYSSGSVTTYVKVYASNDGIALEWYRIIGDGPATHTSTTYIPYESICYIQANKVV